MDRDPSDDDRYSVGASAGDAAIDTDRHLDARVRGRVQGVGFRMFVFDTAVRLGLGGWVANERDGVHCVAEGPAEALKSLLDALEEGPPGAEVDDVETAWSAPNGRFERFTIRSGWHGGD
jgi:acylphosphatase